MKTYDLNTSFQRWAQPLRGTGLDMHILQQAYRAGAQSVAGETLCILSDWATACSGLKPEPTTPSQVYDRAEENLTHYYKQIGVIDAL